MYISYLKLTNVRCFEHLELYFSNEKDLFRKKTLILGNNSTGKSTILKSIALLLSGSSAIGELMGSPDKWINKRSDSCLIEGELVENNQENINISLEIKRGDSLTELITRNHDSLKRIDSLIGKPMAKILTIGYGVNRKVGKTNLGKMENYSSFQANNVGTMFDSSATLYPFETWLMGLDYSRGKKGLLSVKEALKKLLPETEFHSIDKERNTVKFKNADGVLDFDQLSDGFQVTISWIGDLLYRINSTFQEEKIANSTSNILDREFILLIDEVALHLHPAWQRVILQSIANLFSNAQIIVSTHSPFVAQQAGDSELFTIIRNEEKRLELFHYENDPRKLLLHQIVLSDIFGIATDESVFVEKLKDKIRKVKLKSTSPSYDVEDTEISELKGIDYLKELPIRGYKDRNAQKEEQVSSMLENEALKLMKKELLRLNGNK